jgi:branched-subunit amino acid aminotransferase/4-amino-4-deoxychorismate lyase
MKHVIINQKILPKNRAVISVEQRACRFGDGVFETCLVKDGVVYNFENHLKRLTNGLLALMINDFDGKKLSLELVKNSYLLIAKNNLKNGILRIAVSRGIDSKGYLPIGKAKPLIIIETLAKAKLSKAEIILAVSKIKKPSADSLPVHFKVSQNISSILAKIAASESRHFDDIMLNNNDFIAEASSANIFWLKNNQLYTPAPECDILLGTTRQKIIDLWLAKYGKKIREVKAKILALKEADEVFLTNASCGVILVNQIVFSSQKAGENIVKYEPKMSCEIKEMLNRDIKNYVKIKNNCLG